MSTGLFTLYNFIDPQIPDLPGQRPGFINPALIIRAEFIIIVVCPEGDWLNRECKKLKRPALVNGQCTSVNEK